MFNEGCDITKSRKATYTKLETIETYRSQLKLQIHKINK